MQISDGSSGTRMTQISASRPAKVHGLQSEVNALTMQQANWKTEAQIFFHAHQETFRKAAVSYEEQAREIMQTELAQAQRSSDSQHDMAVQIIRAIANTEQQSQKAEIVMMAEEALAKQRDNVVAEARQYLESLQQKHVVQYKEWQKTIDQCYKENSTMITQVQQLEFECRTAQQELESRKRGDVLEAKLQNLSG